MKLSKEALDWLYTVIGDSTKALDFIKRDLEMLEKIKSHLQINEFGKIVYVPEYIEYNGVVMYNDNDIKEWLKNEN